MQHDALLTSCVDWKERIVGNKSIIPYSSLYEKQAKSALAIFNDLIVVDALSSPRLGDISKPWVQDFASAIFGSYNTQTGQRLIKEVMLLISKKNGKSTIAGLLMLTLLITNWRKAAEFLILSPTKEIADNSFTPIQNAINADKKLSKIFHVQSHIRTITDTRTKAKLKIVAANSETVGGKKAVAVLVDELWLFGKKANAENILREATGGLASFQEGIVIYLSTQADEAPSGIFKKQLNRARNIRDGKIVDNSFLPVLYEFPEEMIEREEHLKPENFYISNPNLGASVIPEFLERELKKATENGEESLQNFLSKHLNVEIGLNLRSDRWIGADFWKQQEDSSLSLARIIERSEVIEVGIDGGGLDDLLGLTVLGREKGTLNWLSWSRAWAHKIVLERRKSIASKLIDFTRDSGDVVIINEIGEDIQEIGEIISKIQDSKLLDKIGVDPAQISAILCELIAAGIPQDMIVGISQGWRLGGAISAAERKLADGTLLHAKQPMMDWCIGNARIEQRANSIMITKQASGHAKIDPLMALFNAVHLLAANPAAKNTEPCSIMFWDSPFSS
ncbi:terminase large subunit (plasmid) [Arsenophonus nasoniae]|uniref:terminase large subunit n=2 Tax=Arsenophonus nasoniae TaxID=638 RepID=UPI00246919C6|nr:terminase large subunit [Arsenophonus nasoniae]WGM18552.1 terminase large subunit [Arsenophonus nasoniae]